MFSANQEIFGDVAFLGDVRAPLVSANFGKASTKLASTKFRLAPNGSMKASPQLKLVSTELRRVSTKSELASTISELFSPDVEIV